MATVQKTKRVSWPPDVNLCQVRLFLSEEAPLQSGSGAQDHLQAKTSWLLHSAGVGSADVLPPGFGVPQSSIPKIPPIKWKCPPRIQLDLAWQVATGEESKEVVIQKQRELGVLEAVYPRPSAIPSSPTVSAEVTASRYDDSQTPSIPVIPVEDDENLDSFDSVQPVTLSMISEQSSILPKNLPDLRVQGSALEFPSTKVQHLAGNIIPNTKPVVEVLPTGAKPDVLAAAQAAFTAIMRTNEEGSLIDRDLLVKILSDPTLIEQLLKEYGSSSTHSKLLPHPMSAPAPVPSPPTIPAFRVESDVPLSSPSSLGPTVSNQLHPITKPVVPTSVNPHLITSAASTSMKTNTPVVKDLNYYKNLIQQHGGEKKEAQNLTLLQFGSRPNYDMLRSNESSQPNPRSRDSRGKIPKPCMYFNTPKGCRNGVNCMFLHDSGVDKRMSTLPDVQSAKRMKLEGEITGRS